MDVRVALHGKLSAEELMLLSRGAGEPQGVGLQGDPSVHPKGDQSWMFIGRTDAEAETPVLGPCDTKNWLIWKTLMLGKIEGGRRRGQERMRWLDGIHPWLNGHEFESTLGVGNGQGGLACCSPWGRKELDTTERLNWTNRVKDTLQISQRKINTFIHSCYFQWQCYTLSGNIKIYALLFICTAWLHSFSLLKTYSGLSLCQKMGCKRKKTEYVFLKSWGSSGNRLNTVQKKKNNTKKEISTKHLTASMSAGLVRGFPWGAFNHS